MPVINNNIKFNEINTHIEHQPYSEIINVLDSKRTPFRKNLFFAYNPSFLAANEWNRCVDFYLDKTPQGTMMDLYNIMRTIKEDETPHKETLEKLAEEIIREMYSIPDEITLKGEIGSPKSEDLDGEDDNEEPKELTTEQKNKLEPHIQKRILLNSLIHGAGVHQWVSAFYIRYEQLNNLNLNLIEHYNSYASLVNYYNWQHPMAVMPDNMFNMMFKLKQNQQNQNQQNQEEETESAGLIQGYNKVDIENKNIYGIGINFPVLLHELSKGALEFLLSRGIPEDLDEEELSYLYEQADKYSHEFWHYYMGPTIWRALMESADLETQKLPQLLAIISTLEYEELSNLLSSVVYDSNDKGKELITKIKNKIK